MTRSEKWPISRFWFPYTYHACLVRDKSLYRTLINVGTQLSASAYEQQELPDILAQAHEGLLHVANAQASGTLATLSDLIPQALHTAQHASHEALTGVDTGFSDLNGLTRGWQPTDLIVLAARPGFGKTALALQFAVAAARHRGQPVLIVSLEMSQAQLVMRMLCAEGRVNAYDLRQHDADQRLWGAFMNAGERLHRNGPVGK